MKKADVQFDPAFVEEAVFLNAKAHEKSALAESFHQDREKIYSGLDDESRALAFRRLYEAYFVGMGLQESFEKILKAFPLLCQTDLVIFVKRVWSKKEEESELYIQGKRQTAYIGLQTIRILDPFFLEPFLCHEMAHLSDMLDPDFRYSPCPDLGGENEIEDDLIKEHFRALWNLYVEARLEQRGLPRFSSERKRQRGYEKIFHEMSNGKRFTQGDLLRLVKRERAEGEVNRRDFLKKATEQCAKPFEFLRDLGNHRKEKGTQIAAIDIEQCLAWEGGSCQHCYLACPLRDEAIVLSEGRPTIVSSFCNGCGICVDVCQSVNDPSAIQMVYVT